MMAVKDLGKLKLDCGVDTALEGIEEVRPLPRNATKRPKRHREDPSHLTVNR